MSSFFWANAGIAAQQVTVAVADFANHTGEFRFDSLEKSVPEMLKTELSQFEGITVVERNKLKAVLSEQALGQTGVINYEDAQKVGQLLGAQYVLTGEISLVKFRIRVDAHIVQSQTGKVVGEKVSGASEKMLDRMVQILATNVANNLTGTGYRVVSERVKNYYAPWVLGSAVAAGVATLSLQIAYQRSWDRYENATKLDDIEKNYNSANNDYKARNLMMGVTGILASAALTLWLHRTAEGNKILAEYDQNNRNTQWTLRPYSIPHDAEFGVALCCRW